MKTLLVALLTLSTVAFGTPAAAKDRGSHSFGSPRSHYSNGGHHGNYGHHGSGHGYHGHHSGYRGFSSSLNFVVGLPLYYRTYTPHYVYPRYYYDYPRTVIVNTTPPPVYVQREVPATQAEASGYWYYCPDSQTYYPYVQSCASEWLQVVPQTTPQ